MDLSLYYRFEINATGDHEDKIDRSARKQSLARALKRLDQTTASPLTDVPPAWVKAKRPRRFGRSGEEGEWEDADPLFHAQFAAKLFPLLPVEAWCQSAVYKPMLEIMLKQLVSWTAERLMPSWRRALVHESELARNEPDSQVHHLPRAYDDGLPSSAIRLRM